MITDTIEVKGIIWEDLINYKKISTTLMFPHCTMKCNKECGADVCQNKALAAAKVEPLLLDPFMRLYMSNTLTEALVLQGFEPLDDPISVFTVATAFRDYCCHDDLVIYTGYYPYESPARIIPDVANTIPGNLIVKWGRYIPNQEPHYDSVLGVKLASDNQYGELIKP